MNQHHKQLSQSGFTLIELSLSMAFIAMLLLGIAFLTIQISSIYNKGLTMRAVNESGQLIASDIQRTLSVSQPSQVAFVNDTSNTRGGGRLCASNVVYAWNYAGSLTMGLNNYNRYSSGGAGREVRMIRFIGDDTYCKVIPMTSTYKLLPNPATVSITELLKSGDNTLALHKFTIAQDGGGLYGQAVEGDEAQRLYQVAFLIGNGDQGRFINDSGCAAPVSRVDDEYCAVNQFNFIARAGNKGVSDVFGN